MKRELKFRAWNRELKIMVYDSEDGSADYFDGAYGTSIGMVNSCLKEDQYEWMQFTGLQDKNGRDIYEGDIVMGKTYLMLSKQKRKKSFIVWKEKGFWVEDEHFGWEGEGLWKWYDLEVIGNIHESPDLLK